MNYYVLSIALWVFSGVCLLIIFGQRRLNRRQAAMIYREVWQHNACLHIAEGRPGWETPTDDDSSAMIAVRELRLAVDTDFEVRHGLAAEEPFCGVCGPPVKLSWPVHFSLCSNQNELARRGPRVTLVKLDEVTFVKLV